jgi:hypothetical protein
MSDWMNQGGLGSFKKTVSARISAIDPEQPRLFFRRMHLF